MIDELSIPNDFVYFLDNKSYEQYMTEDPTGINELLDKIYGIAFNQHILDIKEPDFYFVTSYSLATKLAHVQHVENVRIYGRIQQIATYLYRYFKKIGQESKKNIPENDFRVLLWMVYALMYFNENKTSEQAVFLKMLASRIDPEYSTGEDASRFSFTHEISFAHEDANKADPFVKISRLMRENKLELTKYKCALPRVCVPIDSFCRYVPERGEYIVVYRYSLQWMGRMNLEVEDFKSLVAAYKTFEEQYLFYKGLAQILSDTLRYNIYQDIAYAKIIGTDQDPIKKVLDQGKMLLPDNPELPSLPLLQQAGNEANKAGNEVPQDGNVNVGEDKGDIAAFRERCNDVVEMYRAKCKALELQVCAYQMKVDCLRAEKTSGESIADFNDKLEKKYKKLLKQYDELKEKNRMDNEKLTKMSDKVLKENNELKMKVEELQGIISAQQDFDGICLDEADMGDNRGQATEEGDGESVQKVISALMTYASTSEKLKDTQVGVLSEALEEILLDSELGNGMEPSVQLELVRDIRGIEGNRTKIKAKKEKTAFDGKMADQINISLGEQTNQHQGGARQLAEEIVGNLLAGNAGRKEVNDD